MNTIDLVSQISLILENADLTESERNEAIAEIISRIQITEESLDNNIYDIIEWWNNLPSDFNDVKTLFEKRRRLAAHHVFMAKYWSDKNKEYNAAYSTRKMKEAKEMVARLDMIDNTTEKYTTLGKSEAKALIHVEEEFFNAYELKGIIEGVKTIMDAVKIALQAMNQEIAELRGIRGDEQQSNVH